MSHELPDVGDFARIVDACCMPLRSNKGRVVLVQRITTNEPASCECCGARPSGPMAEVFGEDPRVCWPLHWLRKLPPDRQLLEEIEREVVTA